MISYFEDDLSTVLSNTKDCWGEFRGKTLFITGGTGFFGIWLQMSFIYINRELNLNAKLIVLTRNEESFLNKYAWLKEYKEVTFLKGDILDFTFIEEKVDYIIHAATEASVKLNLEEPLTMFETVVNGTKRVLEFARIKKVKSFLLTSSGAVYGKQPADIENIKEDYQGAPNPSDAAAVYGEGKRMAEVLCAVYHKHFNLPVKIARCYAFIGPYLPLDSHFAAGNFISNVIKQEDIVIQGDGTPFRSYMYSADLVTWLWKILFNGEDNRPYNVGSDQSISIADLAQLIATSETEIKIMTPKSNQPVLRYVPNVDNAKRELGLKIYTNLESAVYKTIRFNQNTLNLSKK
ncbi:NAD-dependent epimerase/dehydratase family protein [Pedobacter frigidisoli]|uniref:NAD-dependent epimerase/dehydratase family protein n=1 Tax=Pedobacter frigidisoli TaxID=2530455 RepID=A0A4R0NS93_9SPHI|nr:NAD-dependent epimerase/dehydratase family protein [Pedobacter frigidisoli]TCD01954.1 NAD-dependent epimerase/dehydratase family protein [Pedobacter frigidisoli]